MGGKKARNELLTTVLGHFVRTTRFTVKELLSMIFELYSDTQKFPFEFLGFLVRFGPARRQSC